MDGWTGGRGPGVHQKICAGLRVIEGDGGGVWGDLPHRAAAAGPSDPENQIERGHRRRPLYRPHQAADRQREAGLRHRKGAHQRL